MGQKRIICLVTMLIVLCIWTYTASAMPTLGIEPTFIEVSQGNNFTVNITVEPDGTEVFGAEYHLSFDNKLLNGIDQKKGTFLSQDGTSTINIPNKINNIIGEVEYGETRFDVSYGVTNSGILAVITFNTTESGSCDLILDNVILSDTNAEAIPGVEVNEGICDIVIIDQKLTSTSTKTNTKTTITSTATPDVTVTAKPTDINQISGWEDPQTTETALSVSTPDQSDSSKENTEQSGYSLAFIIIGLLILSYRILRKE